MDPVAQGFLENVLHLPNRCCIDKMLQIFSVVKHASLAEKFGHKNCFSKVPIRDVRNITKNASCWF